mmetsp:Transcript_26930/g.78506  ORF Transcript_26930/g.78506 Transcript_26930/m.78506 type:complete len:395 (+) Transcript_26930:7915-9099(+)
MTQPFSCLSDGEEKALCVRMLSERRVVASPSPEASSGEKTLRRAPSTPKSNAVEGRAELWAGAALAPAPAGGEPSATGPSGKSADGGASRASTSAVTCSADVLAPVRRASASNRRSRSTPSSDGERESVSTKRQVRLSHASRTAHASCGSWPPPRKRYGRGSRGGSASRQERKRKRSSSCADAVSHTSAVSPSSVERDLTDAASAGTAVWYSSRIRTASCGAARASGPACVSPLRCRDALCHLPPGISKSGGGTSGGASSGSSVRCTAITVCSGWGCGPSPRAASPSATTSSDSEVTPRARAPSRICTRSRGAPKCTRAMTSPDSDSLRLPAAAGSAAAGSAGVSGAAGAGGAKWAGGSAASCCRRSSTRRVARRRLKSCTAAHCRAGSGGLRR